VIDVIEWRDYYKHRRRRRDTHDGKIKRSSGTSMSRRTPLLSLLTPSSSSSWLKDSPCKAAAGRF